MVIAGKMMWADIVNPNWIRASSSAVRPNMIAFPSVPAAAVSGGRTVSLCATLFSPDPLPNGPVLRRRSGRPQLGRHDRDFLPSQAVHDLLIQTKVSIDQLARRQCQPLVERDVGVVAALEHFQEAQRRGAGVLDVMSHGKRHVADVASPEIE